jgi:alpha-L-fucosidase 2
MFTHGPVRLLIVFSLLLCASLQARPENLLWYDAPAKIWNEALPVGNGIVGAMVFGGTASERIQFNEVTVWTGAPHDYIRPGAAELLPRIRELILTGKIAEAEKLAKPGFLSDPIRQKAYQPCGDLRLEFPGHEKASEYRRELDLQSAIARTRYTVDGVGFTREVFASYPDRVIVIRLGADKPGRLGFRLRIDSPHKESSCAFLASSPGRPDTLVLSGHVTDGAIRFEARVRVQHEGGTLKEENGAFVLSDADSAVLVLCAATNFRNFQDVSADPAERCAEILKAAGKSNFAQLLKRQQDDYQALYGRVVFDLPEGRNATLPTQRRVALQRDPNEGLPADPSFAALHFNYGRYLLISSSRAGGQPANLQGLWNELLNPPWESKWTTNINCEMNYWPAELANLTECHEPLFALIDDLAVSGRRAAKGYWNSRGWVVHHNTDLWRGSAPINNIDGIWPTGGAWLCSHLWEHYLFTRDRAFLKKRALPVMKEACLFFLDSLVTEPSHGYLVTCPSFSPELSNPLGGLNAGPAMDNQLISALFDSTLEAARVLKDKDPLLGKIAEARKKLPPFLIGKHGQLQEWLGDYDKPNDNHRHMSPLWALYPGNDLTPQKPEAYAAAKLLLKWRGDGSTGWSFAWRIPLWARVGDGDMALRQASLLYAKKTLPNLFDLCGPFQIDGNFGTTAGVAEMLLQSHQKLSVPKDGPELRVIDLLPALPKAWSEGSITGLRTRDGFTVDLAWKNGALSRAVLHASQSTPCLLRLGDNYIVLKARSGKSYTFDQNLTQQ